MFKISDRKIKLKYSLTLPSFRKAISLRYTLDKKTVYETYQQMFKARLT